MIQHSKTNHLFRVSLVFLLLNIPLLSLAQDNIVFAPIGAKWSSATNSDIMQVNRDTSINGVTSRIIDREWQCFDHFKNNPCTEAEHEFWDENVSISEYVYSTDDEVYYLVGDSFYLLYDFGVKKGDVLTIHTRDWLGFEKVEHFDVLVDALDTLEFEGKKLRAYHMKDSPSSVIDASFYRFTGWVVERLGKELYPFPFNNQDEDIFGFPFITQCYQDQDISVLAAPGCVVSANHYTFDNLIIYPNPATDDIYISLDRNLVVSELEIYNYLGKLMMNRNVSHHLGTYNLSIAELPPGTYLLKINNSLVARFIKKE